MPSPGEFTLICIAGASIADLLLSAIQQIRSGVEDPQGEQPPNKRTGRPLGGTHFAQTAILIFFAVAAAGSFAIYVELVS